MIRVSALGAALVLVMVLTAGCTTDEPVAEKRAEPQLHPNEAMAREAYAAFNRKDVPTVMGLFTEDLTMVVPGKSIQSGIFEGKGGAGNYFSIVGKFTAGTHTVEPLEVLANDARVVALLRAQGRHEAKTFDMTVIHVMKIVDGKVAELTIVPTDQYEFDEFWS